MTTGQVPERILRLAAHRRGAPSRHRHRGEAAGSKLPAEGELAERFGVHRNTVRQAVAALAAEHLVVSRRGSGTFVAEHTVLVHRIGARTRLSDSLGRRGRASGRLLESAVEPARRPTSRSGWSSAGARACGSRPCLPSTGARCHAPRTGSRPTACPGSRSASASPDRSPRPCGRAGSTITCAPRRRSARGTPRRPRQPSSNCRSGRSCWSRAPSTPSPTARRCRSASPGSRPTASNSTSPTRMSDGTSRPGHGRARRRRITPRCAAQGTMPHHRVAREYPTHPDSPGPPARSGLRQRPPCPR